MSRQVLQKAVKPTKEEKREEYLKTLIDIKESIPFFKPLSGDEIRTIITDIRFVKYREEEVIIEQESQGEEIYIILSGSCTVFYRMVESKEVKRKVTFLPVAKLGRKDVFGEISTVAEMPRTARVIADSDTTSLLAIKIDMHSEEHNDIMVKVYRSFLKEVSKKILEANKRLHDKGMRGYI